MRKDPIRGANLLLRLCGRKAYVPALVELGRCFFTGEGVPFDPARATELWTRAVALHKRGKGGGGSDEDVQPAVVEAERALAEAHKIGSNPATFSKFQESTLEHLATSGQCYGPFKSPWGATGYVNFLRSKGLPCDAVASDLRCDRLMDGTYLRRPPFKELVALSAELLELARRPRLKATRLLDEWECKDLLTRFVCGARPDLYADQAGDGSTCMHAACASGRLWMVELLLSKGTDACREDRLGRTPWVRAQGYPEVQELLPHIEDSRATNEGKKKEGGGGGKGDGAAKNNVNKARRGNKKNTKKMKTTFAISAEAANNKKNNNSQASTKKKSQDWTAVAAAGLKKATLRAKENPLRDPMFHDPAFYLRKKEKEDPTDKLHVVGSGGGLHKKDSYEHEVLQQIAQLDEASRAEVDGEDGGEGEEEEQEQDEGPVATSDELLEASLVIAFEVGASDAAATAAAATPAASASASSSQASPPLNIHPVYGAAPAAALVALLAHRAPGMFQDLRVRMMSTGKTSETNMTKGEVRAALIKVGAYRSTLGKPCSRAQRAYAEEARSVGNTHFNAKRWDAAVTSYSLAVARLSGGSLRCHPDDAEFLSRVLSNRSAAYLLSGNAHLAASDAFEIVLGLAPAWPKSYLRLGKACEGMGGYADAKTWYECGAKCAGMLQESKQQRDLLKAARRCGAAMKKGETASAAAGAVGAAGGAEDSAVAAAAASVLDSIMVLGEQNQQIAGALGIDEPMFYVPKCDASRLTSEGSRADEAEEDELSSGPTLSSRARYLSTVALKTHVSVRSGIVGTKVGGGRSLHASRAFKQGQVVLSDPPLLSISFDVNGHCDHCGCEFTAESSKDSDNGSDSGGSSAARKKKKKKKKEKKASLHAVPAHDGNAFYCSRECKTKAWSQYYAFMSGPDGDGMSERYAQLRSDFSNMSKDSAALPRSFHVLAACRIAAITMQCRRRGELRPHEGTFDMPAFASLMRPGDLGRDVLDRAGFRLPFSEQYRAFEQCREVLPETLRNDVNLFGFEWYDSIWGTLMMNSVNGGGVLETGEVTSVCLMRAGSFVNHSNDPCCAILPNRDGYRNIAFIALRQIAPGEEVTISYVDPSLTLAEKEKLLATQYFIVPEPKVESEGSGSGSGDKIAAFRAKAHAQRAHAEEVAAAVAAAAAVSTATEQPPSAPSVAAPVTMDALFTGNGNGNGDEEEAASLVIEAGAPSEEPIDLEELELKSEAARLKAEMARLKLENEGLKSKLIQ
jgi:hypothetical protein